MKLNWALTPLALGCLLAAVPAQASSFTYTYQGNDFTVVDVPIPGTVIGTSVITTSDAISGSFTVNLALAPNLNEQEIYPNHGPYLLDISFTDGAGDIEPTNLKDSAVVVSTDANGNITSWKIEAYSVSGDIGLSTCSFIYGGCGTNLAKDPVDSQDGVGIEGVVNHVDAENNGFTFDSPGVWTRTLNETPEPSGFWLLGTGVFMLGSFASRSVRSRYLSHE